MWELSTKGEDLYYYHGAFYVNGEVITLRLNMEVTVLLRKKGRYSCCNLKVKINEK